MLTSKTKAHLFIFTLIFLTPLTNLGTDIYTPSMPAIVSELHAPISLVKLTLTVYLLSYGIGQLLFGILSDSFGRRGILLVGIASYAVFSFFCAITHSIYILITLRLLQGLAASISSVITKSIITDKFKGSRLKVISNYKVLTQILSLIIGPLLGSIIQTLFGWRWNFFILTIYSAFGLFFTAFFLGESLRNKTPLKINFIINNLSTILNQKIFLVLVANIAILYGITALFGVFGPFLVQQVLKYNSLTYGFMALFCGCSYMVGSLISKKITDKSAFNISTICFIIFPSALIFIATQHINKLVVIMLPILVIMALVGLILPKLMSHALGLFKKQAGTASALLGTLVMLGSGTIIGITSLVHTNNTIAIALFYFFACIASIILLLIKT